MNRLTRIAALDVLDRAAAHVRSRYGGPIANGCTCDSCFNHGMGSVIDHDPACPARRLLADLEALLETIKAGP